MSTARKRVVIIGAGIAGLAAAHFLRKRGVDTLILERDGTVGGTLRTILKDDRYLLELGPNTFLASAGPINAIARELSIDSQIVGSDELSRKRYIFSHGCMHPLPMGPVSFLRSGLLSLRGKLRLLAEPCIRTKSAEGESLASFVTRRAGREVLDTLIDPFVSGVWAGNPKELEVESVLPSIIKAERECGSVLRGIRRLSQGAMPRGLLSFRWGMGSITARIEEEMKKNIRLSSPVEGISIPGGYGGLRALPTFLVKVRGSYMHVEADAIVVATPAQTAARLLCDIDQAIHEPLAAIPYAPLAVVHTAFLASDVPRPLDGFGVLIPRKEGIRFLGSIWSSALFLKRCPAGEVLLTNFIGGATDPQAVDLSDSELVEEVLTGLGQVSGIKTQPRFVHIKRWGQAIPQYTIGHQRRLEKIRARLNHLPGIFLTGSYFSGVSVSDTIAHARAEVDRVADFLLRTR